MTPEVRKKMSKFQNLVSFEEAARRISDTDWKKPSVEVLPASDARGRIAAADIRARDPYPNARRSLVDGYAVATSSVSGCSDSDPVRLRIAGLSAAGSPVRGKIPHASCVEIYTGSVVPSGMDAVIPAEDAVRVGDFIEVTSPTKAGSNIALPGEDIGKGEIIVRAGSIINHWHLGAFLSSGISDVEVYSRVVISIIPTGNELFPESEDFINNSTSLVIASMIEGGWSSMRPLPPVHDSAEEIASAIAENSSSDIIILTGGTSLGGMDNVPEAMNSLGSIPVFGGIRTRPGRTTTLYSLNGKPVLSISGFPYAGSIMADLILELILRKMLGTKNLRRRILLPLSENITVKAGYTSFIPGTVEEGKQGSIVRPMRNGRVKRMSSLIGSQGLIIIPEGTEGVMAGNPVHFRIW